MKSFEQSKKLNNQNNTIETMTTDALLDIIANTPMHKRHYCTVTGKILPIGDDGLTDPEREQLDKIKAQWGHSNKDKTSI